MVGKTGLPSVPNLPSFSTWSSHPQPQTPEKDDCETPDHPELERSRSGGSGGPSPSVTGSSVRRLQIPSLGARSARNATVNAAGKASKAAHGAMKGATKMSSALGKKLRMNRNTAAKQASVGSGCEPQIVGRDESAELLDEDEDDGTGDDDADQHAEEDTGYLLHAQYSPGSTPSTESHRSRECFDRSDSNQGSDQNSDTHGTTSGSDSDAERRRSEGRKRVKFHPAKPEPKPLVKPSTSWDPKAFANCRPLACASIWDIPTSREPNPEPSHTRPRELNRHVIEGQRSTEEPRKLNIGGFGGGPRYLPKLSVSVDKTPGSPCSPKRQMIGRNTGRIAVVVCAALSLVVAAVVGAMLLME